MRRWLTQAAAIVVSGLAIVAGAAYLYARQSLAVVDGAISVDGLSASIDIIRDADAVPHIFASTKRDALFGLGYVHAQDRLWQMEFQRRVGNGRLSEIFGTATIPQDRFLRTVGFGRAARSAWDHLTHSAQADVNAYVAGVNAFISTHHGAALPPEFSLLRLEPESWTGVDVIVWEKMMAWDLSANYALELVRDDLARAVGTSRMEQLMPPPAADGLSILRGSGADVPVLSPATRTEEEHASFAALASALSGGASAVRGLLLGGATIEGLGSNNWVIDGTLSTTGKPLLANDPHLAAKIPSTWYLAHMSAGDFDVIGATLPGTPAVALGRNESIAWGVTNVGADVEDLYREQIDNGSNTAMFRGVAEPLTLVAETIKVKGREPIQIQVRVTRHGPLISDAINANNADLPRGPKPPQLAPLALRWTALDPEDTTLFAFLEINSARNWAEFTSALRDFVVPSQNFVYADVNGHIGYYAPGRIPIRAGGDGSRPTDGWSGETEWTGWVPFDGLPHLYDPPDHLIVTANQRPAASASSLGVDWPEPYRATRITELLHATPKLTTSDFARMQGDTVSLHARAMLPLLLSHAHPDEANDRRALEMVRQWNADAGATSGAAAIFEAWFLHLAPVIVGDDLGARATENYVGRYSVVTRFLVNTIGSNDSTWCDDHRTAKVETCADAVTTALHAAVGDLTARLGSDMTRWRWDAVHRAVFPHQGLDGIALLRPLVSRSIPHGGDWSTVNVGTVATDQPFEQHSVSGFREIVDLSPANDSRYLIDVGQSGHPLSKHYDDFLQDWQAVRYRRMSMDRRQIEDGAIGRLRLTPR